MLVDLELHTIVDLLEDRTADTLARWLVAHPGVEVLSRDRAEAYAEGGRRGAPDAVHVADRWHLLKNVRDVLERVLQHHRVALRDAAARVLSDVADAPVALPAAGAASAGAAEPPTPVAVPTGSAVTLSPAVMARRAARRAEREELYQEIRALHAQGLGVHAIGARLGHAPATVRKYLRAATCPDRAPRRTKIGTLTVWDACLRTRWLAGCRDARELWEELRAQGFAGTLRTVQRHVAGWRPTAAPGVLGASRPVRPPAVRPPSPRQAVWWLLEPATTLPTDQATFVARLLQLCPAVQASQRLAQEFRRLVRTRDAAALPDWFAQVAASDVAEFRDFATGLDQDRAAVEAALRTDWSNGQTEGQVTKIKCLKRQMYGRASVGLLRQRLVLLE